MFTVIVLPIILSVLIFYFIVNNVFNLISRGYVHGSESSISQIERKGIILDRFNHIHIDSVLISKRDILKNSYSTGSTLSDMTGRFHISVSSNDSLLYFWKEGYEYFILNIYEHYNWDTIYLDRKN
jgi:hypothetical protein